MTKQLFLLILFFFTQNLYSQNLIYNDNRIHLTINVYENNEIELLLENIYKYPIYLDLGDINICHTMNDFIGAGIYSNRFPYMPNKAYKYRDGFILHRMDVGDVIKRNGNCNLSQNRLTLHVDYIILESELDTLILEQSNYNKNMIVFEIQFNINN